MAELTEVVKLKDGGHFIKLLNKTQEDNLDEEVDKVLLLRFCTKWTWNYSEEAANCFSENKLVNHRNNAILEDIDQSLVCPKSIDAILRSCKLNKSQLEPTEKTKLSDTGNLATLTNRRKLDDTIAQTTITNCIAYISAA